MKKKQILFLGTLILSSIISMSQGTDSLTLKVNSVDSKELLDYFRFEEIGYFKMNIAGEGIRNQYFVLTSNEYWDGEPLKIDTISNSKIFWMKNGKDTLNIRVMSKKIESDTIKFQFHFPGFSTIRNFKTTPKDTYSLRYITSNGEETFARNEPIDLLVYSLPYEDPERPGYLFYCELSREGTPPENWGDKFGVKHYIVFKLHLFE